MHVRHASESDSMLRCPSLQANNSTKCMQLASQGPVHVNGKISIEKQLSSWRPHASNRGCEPPVQYKPHPRWNTVFGLLVIVSVSHALAVLAHMLPKYAWAAQWAVVLTYSCWMLSAVPILLQASRKVVAKKLTFTGDATVVCSGGNAREVWFMNGAMSFSDACAYFLHVTVNLQLNNLCRAPRFVASMLYSLYAFGAIRPKQRTDEAAYYFGMHSSLHRWLREDGHLHFPNCLLWARDPALDRTWLDRWFWSFFRGNTTRHFNLITFKLNHELGICTEALLDRIRVSDAYEIMVLMCLVQGAYSHLAVHLSASQVANCIDTWPLAKRAYPTVNGLGYAAANVVDVLLSSRIEAHQEVLWNNGHNPTPHPRSMKIHQLLMDHSDTYRMMFRAHKDPLVLEAAGGDQMKVSAIIQGSLMHGLDHFLLDMYTPCWQSSTVLGGNGFMMAATFGGGHNVDFTSSFLTPQDAVTARLKRIVAEESSWLKDGYQWAVCE